MRLSALLAVLLLATACGSTDAGSGPDQVTLTLNWYPYGEHAPFYYGLKQGIFKKHGIELKIQPGQGSQKTVQATGAGQTDFGWADTPALLGGVAQGVPVKSLGVYLQTTPASVQFFKDKGFAKPADLKGRTIASTAGDALTKTFPIFLKQNGMSESDVHLQNTDPAGKIAAVISGQTDALLGYASDQGPTMANKAGKEVSYLRFADFGLNYYSNGLMTSESFLKDKPDLVKRMVAATSEAWAAAVKDPRAAVASMAGASQQLPPVPVLTEQFATTTKLLHTDATQGQPPGVNTAADWQKTIDTFAQAGMVTAPKPPEAYWDAGVAPKG